MKCMSTNCAVCDTSKVNRVEVINHAHLGKGREFVIWQEGLKVKFDLQDDGRTLKIFLSSTQESEKNGTPREVNPKDEAKTAWWEDDGYQQFTPSQVKSIATQARRLALQEAIEVVGRMKIWSKGTPEGTRADILDRINGMMEKPLILNQEDMSG